jgi:hypothetical protein
MAKFDWDNADYEAPQDFAIIPEGTEVRLKCTDAVDKETSSGGEMVAATFVVVEGEHKGRKIWTNFNTVNKSEKAQNFGRRMIAGWARACGKPNARSTDELLEKPFWAKLGVEKGTGQYKDKNTIASFLMPEGAAAPSPKSEPKPTPTGAETAAPAEEPASAPKAKPAAPAAGGKKQPWDD